jgi:hydroxymethylglutaryl-CoA synthase
MVVPGIVDTGVYIPRYRLGAAEVSAQWGRPMGRGERAVANHDEDPITMAVEAAMRCMGDREAADIDGLFFASTTSPYMEKQASAVVATAIDLGTRTRTLDLSGSLRAGTGAILAALDAVRAGTASNVIVVAADCRLSEPGSPSEVLFGDGAAALLVGDKGTAADLVGSVGISEDFTDAWRRDGDRYVRTGDPRFGKTHGYMRNTLEAIKAMADCASCGLDDVARFAIHAPDGRSHVDVARALKLRKEAVMDPVFGNVGLIGCAHPLLMLANALEGARPGDQILLTSYSDGSDALLFKATEGVKVLEERARTAKALTGGVALGSYTRYLTFKDLIKDAGLDMRPFSSTIIAQREATLNVRHHGRKCERCGTINTLGLRVCNKCGAKDSYTEVRLSKKGTLHTYTQEHYYPNPDGPVTMSVIDLDDGARFLTQMTDVDPKEVRIGMDLALTFRRLHDGGCFHNYTWKCRPASHLPPDEAKHVECQKGGCEGCR